MSYMAARQSTYTVKITHPKGHAAWEDMTLTEAELLKDDLTKALEALTRYLEEGSPRPRLAGGGVVVSRPDPTERMHGGLEAWG